MRIQSINGQQYYHNVKTNNRNKKVNLKTNSSTFKGYNDVMSSVLSRNLMSRADVESAASNLYFALVKESGITKTAVQPLLSEWFAVKGTYLIEELCKPIAKVRSDLRDIIFKSQDDNLPVIEKYGDPLLYIRNLGKQGFWNSVFENESAPNNIQFVFSSDIGSFEVGTNKRGKLVSEQNYYSGPWTKNTYNMFFGDRIEHKTGNTSDTIIWPTI